MVALSSSMDFLLSRNVIRIQKPNIITVSEEKLELLTEDQMGEKEKSLFLLRKPLRISNTLCFVSWLFVFYVCHWGGLWNEVY
jgi:hypothetical protein